MHIIHAAGPLAQDGAQLVFERSALLLGADDIPLQDQEFAVGGLELATRHLLLQGLDDGRIIVG